MQIRLNREQVDTYFLSIVLVENYIYVLYSEFRERYALLLEVLESTKEEFRLGLSTERKKASAPRSKRPQNQHYKKKKLNSPF